MNRREFAQALGGAAGLAALRQAAKAQTYQPLSGEQLRNVRESGITAIHAHSGNAGIPEFVAETTRALRQIWTIEPLGYEQHGRSANGNKRCYTIALALPF